MYYIIGLPASGKSSLTNLLSDNNGAVILDSDMAKRKLPEYDNIDGGASLVSEESSAIIMSHKRQNLLSTCVEAGMNIIIPKIGHTLEGIIDFNKIMKAKKGYIAYLGIGRK